MLRFTSLAVAAVILSVTPASAQTESWLGKSVITKSKGIKIGKTDDKGRQVVLGVLNEVDYVVTGDQDGWIRVTNEQGVSGWFEKSNALLPDDAVVFYSNQIRQNPNDNFAYNCRAVAWELKGELDIAIKDYNEVLRLNPGPDAYNNRGIAWGKKLDYDKAIADFNEAIRLDPRNTLAYQNRGHAWSDKKDYDKAIADFNQVIRLDPKFVDAYLNRGNAWSDKKNYDKAIADYNEAIRLNPKYELAYNNRGNAWRDKKNHDKAIADYSEAIRLNPKYDLAFYNRANAWSDKKNYAKAIADYNEAIRLYPKYIDAYNGLAWIWATCPDSKYRDGKRAIESAKKGLELDDKDANMMDTLAAAYAENENFDDAVRWEQKALEDPRYQNNEGYRQRLELYRKKMPYRQE